MKTITMTNFITGVTMKVTKEQYEIDLKYPLIKLGYEDRVGEYDNDFIKYNLLTNDCKGDGTSMGKILMYDKSSGYHIENYNPELFLALAAMTEGEDWILGEWLFYEEDEALFEVECTVGVYNNYKAGVATLNSSAKSVYRKATKEELINHFSKECKVVKKENRFPFTLHKNNVQEIMNAACDEWKKKLSKMWGSDILLKGHTLVDEDFYNSIRKACNDRQHQVMDEVFGKDKKDFTSQDMKDGQIAEIITGGYSGRIIQKSNSGFISIGFRYGKGFCSDFNEKVRLLENGETITVKNN